MTAVNGAFSGTVSLAAPGRECQVPIFCACAARGAATHTLYGSLGSEVSVILKLTFPEPSDDLQQ